jgi:hypothetical protein
MPYDFQTSALLPYCVLAVAYLGILLFPRLTRDFFALGLLVVFCLALGVRKIAAMPDGADPVIYASILANAPDTQVLLGGVDYALFFLLHNVTGRSFGLGSTFFLLHFLYLPFLFLLYWVSRRTNGMFYLLVGWMLFVNSGLLLLCNFFRQGMSVFLFLVLLIAFSRAAKTRWVKGMGALTLPFFHVAATAFVPGLYICKTRRFLYLFGAYFGIFCLVIWMLSARLGLGTGYLEDVDQASHQSQLVAKVVVTYVILFLGACLRRYLGNTQDSAAEIQHAAVGFLLPTAALLLTYKAPIIGLRFLYYSHAVAFTYIASIVGMNRRAITYPLTAFGICAFGIITWTYPTVTMLLVW